MGSEFKELIRRFPNNELVDDAAYALTQLSIGGECEGFVACYVGRQWQPLAVQIGRAVDHGENERALVNADAVAEARIRTRISALPAQPRTPDPPNDRRDPT